MRAALLWTACWLLLCSAGNAVAQSEIERVRISSNAGFDRLVLDFGLEPVQAEQLGTGDELVLELGAPAPRLSRSERRQLADLGVALERDGGNRSRLSIERDGREMRVFRLAGDPSQGRGDRLVVDLGRLGGGALPIPADALRVPVQSVQSAISSVASAPRVSPERAPQRQPMVPSVSAVSRPSAPSTAGSWVLVRTIEFEGVDEPRTADRLRALELEVAPLRGGYAVPAPALPVERVTLRALTGDDRNGRKLSRDLLLSIVAAVRDDYARNGKPNTRVVRRSDQDDLERDGRLVLRIEEPLATRRSAR